MTYSIGMTYNAQIRAAVVAQFGNTPAVQKWRRLQHTMKYHHRQAGFFRMNVCGWRFVLIDTVAHRPIFSDRQHCLRVGRFMIGLRPAGV